MVVLPPSVTEPFSLNSWKVNSVPGMVKGPVDPESSRVVTSFVDLTILADMLIVTAFSANCSDVWNWPLYVLPSLAEKLTVDSPPLNGTGRLNFSVVGPASNEDIIIKEFRLRLVIRMVVFILIAGGGAIIQ